MHHYQCYSEPILSLSESAAARLRWRLGLSPSDEADLRQELLADLTRRLRRFDPARGSLGAFARVVLRNHAARIADRVSRERRRSGGPILSLDAPVGSEPLVETLPGEVTAAATEVRIDVSRALARLQPRDQALCAAVVRWPVDHLAANGFGSRAGLYRRLRELRFLLAANGLEAAA
jgi:RNA polymerase sigma-70 factor (ECF subfamily)